MCAFCVPFVCPRFPSKRKRISREWRQKIESWLQANEQDDRQTDDYKRSRSRRIAGNRRSFENDSGEFGPLFAGEASKVVGFSRAENERSKLDTLPEERPAAAAMPTTPTTTSEPYKRVYPDYKPSTGYDKAEATASAEPAARDKSAWRKSNLNVPNTSEEVEYGSRSARNKSREPVALQSIVEEDRRRNLCSNSEKQNDESPKSTARRPPESMDYEPVYQKQDKSSVGITSDQHSIYIRPPAMSPSTTPTSARASRSLEDDHATYNTVEIDSDNIETPPTVRRGLSGDKSVGSSMRKSQVMRSLHRQISDDATEGGKSEPKSPEKPSDGDPLGDGQFDRHSSARRTRRYRRLTDHSSGNEERNDTSPESPSPTDPLKEIEKKKPQTTTTSITLTARKTEPAAEPHILSRVGKIGRNLSSINQEAVQEAIRNLKSPTETPERIWSPPREIVIKDRAPALQPVKVAQHELNDEGFEETQSLVSDTPSHGKESTSSCNDQPDASQAADERAKMVRMTSSESTSNDASVVEPPSSRRALPKSTVQKLLERNQQSLERSRSLRTKNLATAPTPRTQSVPKRATSMRKADTSALASKRDVERSSSRNSLRSSRSSLNSSASTNTVRHLALKTPSLHASANVADSRKKPLSSPSPRSLSATKLASARTPASRSSSSGSSIGPSPRRSAGLKISPPSQSSSTSPTHAKDYSAPQRPSHRPATSHSSHSNSSLTSNLSASRTAASPSARLSNLSRGVAAKTSSRVNNFMRPTAASATKMSNPKGK